MVNNILGAVFCFASSNISRHWLIWPIKIDEWTNRQNCPHVLLSPQPAQASIEQSSHKYFDRRIRRLKSGRRKERKSWLIKTLEGEEKGCSIVTYRDVRTIQTGPLIGQEVQLSSSCSIRQFRQTNNNALIGGYYTMFTVRPPPSIRRRQLVW